MPLERCCRRAQEGDGLGGLEAGRHGRERSSWLRPRVLANHETCKVDALVFFFSFSFAMENGEELIWNQEHEEEDLHLFMNSES